MAAAGPPGWGICRDLVEEEKGGEERRERREAGKGILQNSLTAQDEAWTSPKRPSGRLERRRLGTKGLPPFTSSEAEKPWS